MSNDSKKTPWWQNPNIQSALITGFLGLVGTVITVRATRPPAPVPAPAPAPARPFTLVDSNTHHVPEANPSDAFAMGSSESLAHAPIDLSLNFAEYQRRLAKPGVTKEEVDKYAGPLKGKTVVWEGFFDELTMHTQQIDGSHFTISLVENQAKATQSMFATPALFRMAATELAAARTFRKGDPIKLMGRLEDFSIVGSIVVNGHILEPAIGRTANVASGPTSSTRQ